MIWGYSRCSTQSQSLDIQVEQLRQAGCEVVYEEKASGTDDARPVLAYIIKVAVAGDVVVVCRLDRLARSTRHLLKVVEDLEAKGVSLKILNINIDTATATGRMLLTMLSAVATMEVQLMKERQAEGIAKAKAAGKYTGRLPTARRQSEKVLALREEGHTPQAVADACGIGVASVYRICKAAGVYKGKAPVIREAATEQVLALRAHGVPHKDIAFTVGIGVTTVYRICRAEKESR
jgi:DNA invertase Pin-like site-specific DNA recombinase